MSWLLWLWCVSVSGTSPNSVDWVSRRLVEQGLLAPAASEKAPLFLEAPRDGRPVPEFVPPTSFAPLVRQVRGGVVNVKASRGGKSRSLGSGFLIHPTGLVVTNHHVVDQAVAISVTLNDGREFPARVLGADASTDVALVSLADAAGDGLPALVLGDSDALEVGDWVVAIGNPFGLEHSVAHGLVSARERVIGLGQFDDFLQMDVPINPGNSGGPLFNMRGEVVGLSTATVRNSQGLGFAVPINMVKALLPHLHQHGRLQRGWLGVSVREEKEGARVQRVFDGGPAALAGLAVGDLILSVNGKKVDGYRQMLRHIALVAPGTKVRLRVLRGKERSEREVTLSTRPATLGKSAE